MTTFDHDRSVTIQRASLATETRMIAGAAPDSILYEHDGIVAAIVPSAPWQPIANMATYESSAGLLAGLDGLAAAYRAAGVRKWSIWVPGWDTDAVGALTTRGFCNAARLPAILLDLETFEPMDYSGLNWDDIGSMPTLGLVNEAAHEDGEGLAAALRQVPDGVEELRLYEAQEDGETVAVVVAIDNPGANGKTDCGVYFGATDPRAAGKRLGRMLLTAALVAARDRGCATASGQASTVGAPIWESLGFETVFMFDTYTWTERADA